MATRLQRRGYSVGRYQARSLMREAGVVCRQRRRFRATTDSDHGRPVAPNRLARGFDAATPNTVWCADITAVRMQAGWLYLAAVLDLCGRQVVGWAIAAHMRTQLTLDALDMALGRRRPRLGLLHHSDRGSQYAAGDYQDRLRRHKIVPSMSRDEWHRCHSSGSHRADYTPLLNSTPIWSPITRSLEIGHEKRYTEERIIGF